MKRTAPPPPPRSLIKPCLIAVLLLLPVSSAIAQTITINATGNNGDRDPNTPGLQVHEGDRINVNWTGSVSGLSHQSRFGGTATLGVDTSGENIGAIHVQCLNIPDPLGDVVFTIRDDTTAEGDETITITVFSASNIPNCNGDEIIGSITTVPITITILANDGASQANLGGADATVFEGRNVNVPITFTGQARTAASTVNFSLSGTAAGTDYTVDDSGSDITFDTTAKTGTVTIAHTATSGSIPITIVADTAADNGETVIVTLTSHSGGGSGVTGFVSAATRTYTTSGDVTFTITAGPTTIAETDADADTAAYTITRTGAAVAATVSWEILHRHTGDATEDDDFTALSSMVAFAAGEDSKTFTINVVGDNSVDDAGEIFFLRVNPPDGLSRGDDYGPITLSDDDTAFAITAGPDALTETDSDDATTAYTITRSGLELTANTVVTWTVHHAATAGTSDADFSDTNGTVTFAAGEDSQTFTLTIIGDDIGENTENFTLRLTSPGHAGGDYAVTLADNDTAFTITAGPASLTETDADADTTAYTITRSGVELTAATTVTWTVNHAATAGTSDADFTAVTGMVSFAAGEDSQTFTVNVVGDTINESTENFSLSVSAAGHTAGDNYAVTLADNDAISLSIAVASDDVDSMTAGIQIGEGRSAMFTVSLDGADGGSASAVTVAYTISGDVNAADLSGISSLSGTLTIAAGQAEGVLAIPLEDDADTASEDLTVTINASGHTAAGAIARSTTAAEQSATVKVITRVDVRTLELTRVDAANFPVTSNSIAEGDANVTLYYTVSLAAGSTDFTSDTTINWTIDHADTNGTSDADFTAVSGSVTHRIQMPGTPAPALPTVTVTIIGDNLNEASESFTVSLSVAGDAAHDTNADATSTITITDDDAIAATISGGGNVTEGGNASVTVNLGAIPTTAVSVAYTITAGTAIAADYTDSGGGSITIAANTDPPSGDISVAITDDNINEGAETFSVTVTAADISGQNGAASVSGGAQTFTIAANDPIALSATATAAVSEGGNATVSVALGATAGRAVTVAYAIGSTAGTADVDAVAADYTDTSGGDITIAGGASGGDITIALSADNLNEAAETFTVTITAADISGEYGTASVASGGVQTFTIAASDDISVSIAADAMSVDEGDSVTFSVTFSGATNGSAANITVAYTLSSISVTPTDADSGSITINAGGTDGTVTLGIPFSATLDSSAPDETLTVTLGTITVAGGGGTATAAASPNNSDPVTVNYVDAAHTIAFSSPALTITEGASATYSVSRTGPAIADGSNIVVSWTYTAGTVDNDDFTTAPAGGMLTFSGNENSKTFSVNTAQDTDSEPGETFTLGLTATNAVLISNGGVALPDDISVTIGESDRPVTLEIAAPAGNLTEGTAANFTVRFTESVTTTEPLTVDWTAAPAADFATANGTATIAAGMSSVDVAITATADNLNEGDEMFTVTLSNAAGGGAIAAPTVHTTDNVATATIAASDPIAATVSGGGSVAEGGDATVTVNLGVTATTAVTVAYTIAADTATAADYTDTSGGDITIAAGESSGDITIAIVADTVVEPAETFSVTITAADISGHIGTATIAGGGTQTFTIAAGIGVTVNNATPREGDTVTFTVTLSGGAPATVDWAITGDDADYNGAASGSLMFTAVGAQTVTVAIADDDLIEGDGDRITFTLSNAAGDDIAAASVTITDNDAISVTITGPSDIITNTTATYTVDLGGRVLTDTTVAISDADDITIAAGQRSGTFTVAAGSTGRTIVLTATANGVSGTLTVTVSVDNPGARAARVTAPVAAAAQSVGQLASAAVGRRLTFVGGNTVNLGGVAFADAPEEFVGAWATNPFAREQAFTVGGGNGTSAKELLDKSSFALSLGGDNINFWGSGGKISANGEVNGVRYDGDSTAWHLGADTLWGDGLLGVAVAQTSGDTDFTAAGVKSKLKSDITSVHPYLTRNWRGVKLWGSFGYGAGDAELIETDTFHSDINVLSLSGGVTLVNDRNVTFHMDVHWSRAELDSGNANGKVLPKVTADTMRINIGGEIGANFTDELRPFATLNIRRDFGDAQEGGAADYGGGVEWTGQQIHARLEARNQAQGDGADEDSLSLSVRRNATGGIAPYARWNLDGGAAGARLERGRLSVGMEVGVADNAMEFKNLLSGELRF